MSEIWKNEHSSHFTYRFSGVYFVLNTGSPPSFRRDVNVNLVAALIYLIFRLQTKHLQKVLVVMIYGWNLMLNLEKHITLEIFDWFDRFFNGNFFYNDCITLRYRCNLPHWHVCLHQSTIYNLHLGAPCWRYRPYIVLWANYMSCLTPLVYHVSSIAGDLLSKGSKCRIQLSFTWKCKPCVVVYRPMDSRVDK